MAIATVSTSPPRAKIHRFVFQPLLYHGSESCSVTAVDSVGVRLPVCASAAFPVPALEECARCIAWIGRTLGKLTMEQRHRKGDLCGGAVPQL